MTDQNPAAQVPQSSYVDTYQPPIDPSVSQPSGQSAAPSPILPPDEPQVASAQPSQSSAVADPVVADDQVSDKSGVSQALEDQNIFYLLGVDGTDEEKEHFLDELQQVIWEDFLSQDVELLITEEEQVELSKIMANKSGSDAEQQERILSYLDALIPDLEEIMLEKALELKEDMAKERIAGLREYFALDDAALAQLDQASAFIADDQWRAAADIVNNIR